METLKVTVENQDGLHARPARVFVKEVQKYQSTITLISPNGVADAKSILSILALGISKGTQLTIQAEGKDEKDVITAIENIVNKNLLELVTDECD